ncbi:RNA methyltransferase [bacterium]|nr:RNA methyltransferase [bacterium]
MEITSVNNELVKESAKLQQKKYRTQSGKFLLEGYKAIKEAFDCGIKIDKIFVEKSHLKEYEFAKDLIIETTEPVLKKLTTTESAPEAIAIGFQKNYDKNLLKNTKKVVLLEDIKDLGNLGTIIRSSVAFGADAIVLYGESVDIYNPKCVRASVGNLWKLPIIHLTTIEDLEENFKDFERIATLPRTNNLLKTFVAKQPCLVMFGSEANGLSEDLIKFSTTSVKIEMAKTVESLNLATSVSVILYELFV